MIYINKIMRRCLISIAIILGVTLVDVTSVLATDDIIIYEDKDTLLIDAEQTLLDETSDNDGSSVIGEQLEDRSSGEETETIEQPEGILSDESSVSPSSGQDVLINDGTEEIIVQFYDAQPDDGVICVEARTDDIIQYGGYPSEVPQVDRSAKLLGATGDTYTYKAAVDKAAETLRGWNGTDAAITVDFTSYNIPKNNYKGLFDAVINSHPELFYITDTYEYYYSGNKLTRIKFEVDRSYSKSDVDKFNNKVSAIIKGVNSSWTDMQKLIYIHDYLALHINYDTTYNNCNAYNALIDGKCVCQGYALAYSYLVNKINSNFDCLVISSKVNNHAWNMVTLGGRRYYVDVTGDDRPGSYEFHEMHHNNIVSKAKLISSNKHEGNDWIDQYGNNVYSIGTSNTYDSAVWRNMESPMPMVGNKGVYYTGSDPMNIYLYDFSNGNSSLLKSYKAMWKIRNTGNFYACSFSSLATIGNRVIVTLPDTIKVIDLYGNEIGSYASKSSAGYIYGARLDGNELSYDVHTSPASNETNYIGRYKQTVGNEVDKVEAFVTRLYKVVLGRNPDAGGLAHWTQQLKSKRLTGAQVVQEFYLSPEMQKKNLKPEEFVNIAYRGMMGREADAGGRVNWVDALNNGASRRYVVVGFIGSNEFTNLCKEYGITKGTLNVTEKRDKNIGATKYCARLYTKALGRGYDVNGLNYWCGKILADKSRANVIRVATDGFFNSTEFKNREYNNDKFVRICYNTFLDRNADADGLNYWKNKLKSGMTRDQVIEGFARSTEFDNIMKKYGL